MTNTTKNFCFCTLAFNRPYRMMAKELASDLEKYAPGFKIIVGNDNPQDFKNCKNVISYYQKQQGILHCYNDKRFAIAHALSLFDIAIFIDADTRIQEKIPTEITKFIGVQGVYKNLIEHTQKYRPDRLDIVKKLASKLNINLSEVSYFGESLLMFSNQDNQSYKFVENWGKIGKYLELNGIHSGEGITIGLAAFQMGWQPLKTPEWEKLNHIAQHIDASLTVKKNGWQQLQRRLGYHYRLNKERLLALKDFDFYYG
ncbi:hypothetical protein [Crocosphaera chwakensis]|uniref:Glycosyltransferase 2-like domain-containing protein n=1 Tax=Crocosphaera chwakensis CCY0110 TaxID=391612 RepID=A3IK11_9CHRO|nr:hypothetical protein [Crocosphaera chwakensis]EAZ93000.1 hypothetical protein CY0110_02989 [Crocosphaera chwakensis CCY0110]